MTGGYKCLILPLSYTLRGLCGYDDFSLDSPNTQWKFFIEWQFEKIGGISIFQNAHIAINDIENRKLHSFYESLIVAWSQFFTVEPTDKYKKVLAQPLFFNNLIKTPQGKSLFYPRPKDKGIIYLNDISSAGVLESPEQIKMKYQLNGNETFQYISLCKCLQANSDLSDALTLTRAGVNCKPTSATRLNTIYGISEEVLTNIYKLPFMVTIETKMRSFQFKFHHLIFYTNLRLHQYKMVDSNLCTFCDNEPETFEHLFIECPIVKPLWTALGSVLNYQFSVTEKFFGCFQHINGKQFHKLSHTVILLKYYIHICRIKKNKPQPNVMMKRIDYAYTIEESIAQRRGKVDRHH